MENNELITLRETVEKTSLKHIAFIMDGNGRWATGRNQLREMGHRAGAENLKKIVRLCGDIGIHAVTVYAFSTENWKRPALEVNAIMQLLDKFIKEAKTDNEKNKIRYVFLGDKGGLAPALAEKCEELENLTKDNPSLLNIALNYGGRAELVHACRKLAEQGGEIILLGGGGRRAGRGLFGLGVHGGLQALRPVHGFGLGVLLIGQVAPSLRFLYLPR